MVGSSGLWRKRTGAVATPFTSVWENLIDRARAVAYIRYHIDFRACLRAWFVARLESAMETSGQDRLGIDTASVDAFVSGIEPVER